MGDLSAFTAPAFRERLSAVLAETARAKALPNPCYVDPDFLAFERARLYEALTEFFRRAAASGVRQSRSSGGSRRLYSSGTGMSNQRRRVG